MLFRSFGILLFIGLQFATPQSVADDFVFTGKPREYEDYGYFIKGAAWHFEADQRKTIYVCWENADRTNETERRWIKEQVESTWQRHSRLEFSGWQSCAQKNYGIRIVFSDDGPHVKAFGRHIDGVKNGMVLNNYFRNWSPECQDMRESCIRSIAAHEFGHALGFAHEQNRPDTPGECRRQHGQGQNSEQVLTQYDPRSVMNYCNSVYNNDGQLSPLDIKALQTVYGAR